MMIGQQLLLKGSDFVQHFFVSESLSNKDIFQIEGEEANHIINVLRKKKGDNIFLADGSGLLVEAEIIKSDRKKILAKKIREIASNTEPLVDITLVQALPKKDKMDLIIQKGTELGVSSFAPVISSRVVIKIDEDKAASRRERWQKIAIESSKQSGRVVPPFVHNIFQFKDCLEKLEVDLLLFPWEEKGSKPLQEAFGDAGRINSAAICIGPEGGWSYEEVEFASKKGAEIVSLGPRILRTETAALVAITTLLFCKGDLGG